MLPVTISLGLINFNLLINSLFGSLVSDEAPAAIDKAFRIYQLPQGIFSVAIATVLFPTLARFADARARCDNLRATMANGMRQILFVLVPAAAAVLVLCRTDDPPRLPARRIHPAQTALVGTALFWFAFSLPTNGLYLLQTRTFFSLQRPWMATGLACIDLVVSALGAFLLYKPFGTGGWSRGPGSARPPRCRPGCDPAARVRRPGAGQAPLHRTRITIASAALAGVSSGVWDSLDGALGRGLVGQIISLGLGLGLGALAYSRSRSCCGSPSWSRSPASFAGARAMLGAPRYLLGVLEIGVLVGFAWLGAAAVRRRLVPDLTGAPAPPRPIVLAAALLIWVAEAARARFGCSSGRCRICLAVGALGGWEWALRRVSRGEGGPRTGPSASRPPRPRQRTRRPSLDRRDHRRVPRSPRSCWPTSPADVHSKLTTGMTGFDSTWYHGPFAAGLLPERQYLGPALHRAAVPRLVLPGERRNLPRGGDARVRSRPSLASPEPRLAPRLPVSRSGASADRLEWRRGRSALGAIALSVPALVRSGRRGAQRHRRHLLPAGRRRRRPQCLGFSPAREGTVLPAARWPSPASAPALRREPSSTS